MATAYNVVINSVMANEIAYGCSFTPYVIKKVDGTETERYHVDRMDYNSNNVSHGVALVGCGLLVPQTDPVGSGNIELLFVCGATTYKATVAPATLKGYGYNQSITVSAVS